MAEFDAGTIKSTADINITPFLKGLEQAEKAGNKFDGQKFTARADIDDKLANGKLTKLEKRLRDLGNATAKVSIAGAAAAERQLQSIDSKSRKLDGRGIGLSAAADTAEARAELTALEAIVKRLDKRTVRITAKADTAGAARELGALDNLADAVDADDVTVNATANTTLANQQLVALSSLADGLDANDIDIATRADTAAAQAQIRALSAVADQVDGKTVRINARAETMGARALLQQLEAAIRALNGRTARVRADADVAAAMARIAALEQQLSRLNGKRADVGVDAGGLGQAHAMLMLIVAALAMIGSAAPAAAAALAAIPSALMAAGQAAGALMAGLSGIGGAYSAMGQQDTASAGASNSAAKQRQAAADRIKSALAGVQSAQTGVARAAAQAARSQIQSAWAIADAERAVGEARRSAARSIADAVRAEADARASAARAMDDANRQVERSSRSLQRAQQDLTRAWEQGREELEDLQLTLEGTGLSEERAVIALERARQRLEEGMANGVEGLEYQELSLDYREADLGLRTIQERMGDLRAEQDVFAREGIAGSQAVKSAKEQVLAAEEAYGDSVRARQFAEIDGNKQIADAVRARQQAEEDGARQIADAERALERARVQAGWAAQDAAWAQEDAARALAAAQDQLAQAYRDQGEAGAGAAGKVDKLAQAMAKLSPAGRRFVEFLYNEWRPAWNTVTDAVAEAMLPKLQRAMTQTMDIFPDLSRGLAGTGDAIGNVAIKASNLMVSGPFREDFSALMASNNRAIEDLGTAGVSLTGAFVTLGAAAAPMVERFTQNAEASMAMFAAWLEGKQQSGQLDAWFRVMGDQLAFLWGVIKQTVVGIWDFTTALAPLGNALLSGIAAVVGWVGEFAQAHPTLTMVIASVYLAYKAFTTLGTALAAMKVAAATSLAGWASMAAGARNFGGSLGALLNPMQSNAAALYSMVGATDRASAAKEKATNRTTMFGRALQGAANALPLIGAALIGAALAYDALTTSSGEAADALLQGGSAASKMRAELAANDAKQAEYTATMGAGMGALREWATGMLGTETTTKQATAALEGQIAAMPPLEAAKARVTLAESAYQEALRQSGPGSLAAAQAMDRLKAASREVEIQEIMKRDAVNRATAELIYQRDQALGLADANLRLRQASNQLAKDQQAYAEALRAGGPASQAAIDAGLQLESTQLRVAQAAKESAGGQGAYVDKIKEMVAASGGNLTPTLERMIGSLDMAGLAALGASVKTDALGRSVIQMPNGKTIVVDANTSPAAQQLTMIRDLVNRTRGTVGVDADPTAGVTTVGGFKFAVDATRGVMSIDGNITPAEQQRLGIQAKTDGTTGTMWIDGNPVPADGRLNGMRVKVDGTTGVMSIDANPQQASDKNDAVHRAAEVPTGFAIDSNPAEANRKNDDAHRNAERPSWFTVNVDDGPVQTFFKNLANWVQQAARWLNNLFSLGNPAAAGFAAGGFAVPMANGGVLAKQVIPMAAGGALREPKMPGQQDRDLTPMRGGYATTVRPGSWRVIGDNMKVPEAYIPINDSGRSKAILTKTARAMGYALVEDDAVQMATGGVLTPGTPAVSTAGTGAGAPAVGGGGASALTGRSARRWDDLIGSLLASSRDLGSPTVLTSKTVRAIAEAVQTANGGGGGDIAAVRSELLELLGKVTEAIDDLAGRPTVVVNPSEQMDEQKIGRVAAEKATFYAGVMG